MSAVKSPAPLTPFGGGALIPRALRREKRWAPWVTQWLPKARGGAGKWDKRPAMGKSTARPDTWMTFEDALNEIRKHPGKYAGIGFVTTGQRLFVGVDLDRCVENGVIAPWAQEVVAQLCSYTEISPSGTGLRIMLSGHVPNDWNNHEIGIEVYGGNTSRFLTITGQHVTGTPAEVRSADNALQALERRYARERATADVIELNMPDLIDDLLLPSLQNLDIPPAARDFLDSGAHRGDRSRELFATAVALYGAGLQDDEVFSILAQNEHAMEIALDHRRQDHDRAMLYLWREQCCKGKARVPQRLTADDFEDVSPVSRDLSPVKEQRFRVLRVDEFLKRERPSWIIKGLLPSNGLCVLFGESGSGKSFFTLDMAAAVARGVEWRGMKVKQGKVAYICAEGVDDFQNRVDAYVKNHEVLKHDFEIGIVPDAPNLLHTDDVRDLTKSLCAFGELAIVVVDTAARVMPGANENSGEDMGRMVKHCDLISRVTGALVVLVHHSGKDSSRGARGWSGLRAAADVEIEVVRSGEDRAAKVTKQKGGPDGQEFGFKLITVPIGVDEDSDEIASCVIQHTVAVPKAERQQEPKGENQKIVLRTLQRNFDLTGEGMHANDLAEAAANEIAQDPNKRDTRRQRCLAAITALVAANRLVQQNGVFTPK